MATERPKGAAKLELIFRKNCSAAVLKQTVREQSVKGRTVTPVKEPMGHELRDQHGEVVIVRPFAEAECVSGWRGGESQGKESLPPPCCASVQSTSGALGTGVRGASTIWGWRTKGCVLGVLMLGTD